MVHGKLVVQLYGVNQLRQLGISDTSVVPSGRNGFDTIRLELIVSSWLFEEGDGCWEESDWNLRQADSDWIYLSTVGSDGRYLIVGLRRSELLGFKQRT